MIVQRLAMDLRPGDTVLAGGRQRSVASIEPVDRAAKGDPGYYDESKFEVRFTDGTSMVALWKQIVAGVVVLPGGIV